MSIKSNLRRVAAAAALTLAAVGAAQAHAITASTGVGNIIVPPAGSVIMTSALFANPAGARFIVHFAAECAVNAPAGNTTAWTDVDIVVLSGAVVVATLSPTAGNQGAFCAADGSFGLSGWSANSVIAVGGTNLAAGVYRVQVRARLNFGATQASYGERTLLVTR